jgi:hypothetical protein
VFLPIKADHCRIQPSLSNKELYRVLCQKEPGIPIFSQCWWLDAVGGESNWDVAMVIRGGSVLAALPYYCEHTLRMNKIVMPVLTQTMGPWLNYPAGQKLHTKLSFEKECLTELIEMLPPFDVFQQNFHYSIGNWLPFYWKGFNQSTRYTYVLENIGDSEVTFERFRSNIKTDIRKAIKHIDVMCGEEGIEEFYQLNALSYERQGMAIPYSLSFIRNLDAKCAERRCRKIFFAKDQHDGKIHAAAYLVWDRNSAYYLMGGGDPLYRNSGATSLMLWKAIQYASTVANTFDFEGSMLEPVERFFRSFGAIQKPYFQITKRNYRWPSMYRFIQTIRHLGRG